MNFQSYVSSVFTIETQFRKYTFKIKCNVWLNLLRMILFILLLYKLFSTIATNNFLIYIILKNLINIILINYVK